MDAFMKTMLLALATSTLICATPLERRDADVPSTEPTPDVETTTTASTSTDLPDPSSPLIEEEIIIHKHEDEDIVKESPDGVPEVVHRDIDEYISPNGEEIIVVSESEDDLFDVAESGLVFRPRFQYSQVQRRRRYRNPVRRYYRRRY